MLSWVSNSVDAVNSLRDGSLRHRIICPYCERTSYTHRKFSPDGCCSQMMDETGVWTGRYVYIPKINCHGIVANCNVCGTKFYICYKDGAALCINAKDISNKDVYFQITESLDVTGFLREDVYRNRNNIKN